MFDKFEPFHSLQKQPFSFQPARYEIWSDGKMEKKGRTITIIRAKVVTIDSVEKTEVSFNDLFFNHELSDKIVFDEFITATDRLQLITIPEETNCENIAISVFKMTIGSTRECKNFFRNEPFCCSLFIQAGKIEKVSFSFSNPERLIEFYSDLETDVPNEQEKNAEFNSGNEFENFKNKLKDLPLSFRYRCDVYDIKGEKIINNEKGLIHVDSEQVVLKTYDGSGDYIRFYNKGEQLFCAYMVMNGDLLINQEVGSVKFHTMSWPDFNMLYKKVE
jgi:hypothetical protein